jgi:hypothetical protein
MAFLSATDILSIAETPQFNNNTTQQSLAASVLQPNMDDWQRPLDPIRVQRIAAVFKGHELMPNPVLLSENGTLQQKGISVNQLRASNGIPTNLWEVSIDPTGLPGKPLWILDGQHRINGLFQSGVQAKNDIPVVLLLNDHTSVYTGSILAKLFAQVTTGAQPLDDLHNAWLTFAFKLGQYDTAVAGSGAHNSAMETVAIMCSKPQFTVGQSTIPNIFVNNIRFNEKLPPTSFAFAYDCTKLKDLIHRHYYACTSNVGSHLPPIVLAAELCRAVQALQIEVSAPHKDTVFLGDDTHAQTIMKDAFLVGVLTKLLNAGAPFDWRDLLQTLQFSLTNWNLSWTISLSGSKTHPASRKIALSVFETVFVDGVLPQDPTGTPIKLNDFLRGNAASIDLVCSLPTAAGRGSSRGAITFNIPRSATLTPTVQNNRHLALRNPTGNIAAIRVFDGDSRPGKPVTYPELLRSSGLLLDPSKHANPLKLEIMMQFYGAAETRAEVEVSWVP